MQRHQDDYRNKVVLVTGAASGIGAALARALAQQAAVLVLADIDQAGLESLRQELGDVTTARLNVSNEADFKAVIDRTVTTHGRLDVLVNNAGLALTGELFDCSISDWHEIRSVNLDGVIYGSMHAYPVMKAQGTGQIINIASVAGFFPYPLHTLYTATKYAEMGFSSTLRMEAKAFGVRVNVVCPGAVDTPIFQSSKLAGLDREKAMQVFRFPRIAPALAAKMILREAARDKPVIICPPGYLWLWRLARWAPGLLELSLRKLMRELRGCRLDATDRRQK